MLQVIGKVSATEKMPSTIDNFYFWTDKGQILSPFDIVKVEHVSSNSDKSITYGVIEEITHVTDAASHFTNFISSNFGDTADSIGQMNRLGMNYVKAKVVCNTDDIYTPVLDGKQVSLCDEEDIRTALGQNDVKNPLVCGYLEMYQGNAAKKVKVELNSHFLIGPDGAHLNISGISGLAAKTSYSMFLLNAIQHKFKDIDGSSVAFVFFNVKGRDLMAIDETNTELPEKDKKIYADLGLSIEPFKNVRYYYPYTKDEIMQHAQSYAHPQDVERQKKNHKAFTYKFTYDKSQDKLDEYTKTAANGGVKNEIQVTSWRKFKRCVSKAIKNDIFSKVIHDNVGEVDLTSEIQHNLTANQVMVIDIARLDENSQSFVFGSVARAIYEMKLGADRDNIPDKIILFVDELNKYASNDIPKNSPILRQLLEITERGRSLGIILFSVEQFRSAIHDRVKGNCSTHAYGRTNAIEISKADYKYVPKVYQNMMTRLSPGEYIISNPALRSIVNIRFPRPTYKQFPNG